MPIWRELQRADSRVLSRRSVRRARARIGRHALKLGVARAPRAAMSEVTARPCSRG